MTPPPFFISPSSLPYFFSLSPNAFRAPRLEATSQIWTVAFDPAAASVKGVSGSGENPVVNTLPCLSASHYGRGRGHVEEQTAEEKIEMQRLEERRRKTHQAQISTRSQTDLPLSPLLPLCLFIRDIPNLDQFIHSSCRNTSSDVWIDVECGCCAIVG